VGQKTKKLLIPGMAKRFFSSAQITYQLWGSPNSISIGYWGPSLGPKRPGWEADQLPISSAESYLHSPMPVKDAVLS
jgi:hypothetical protein